MEVYVNNCKFLFLYRFRFFRNVLFKTKKEDFKDVVNALNIHDKRKRIEYIYDNAIKYINLYYSDDLCKFVNDQCIAQRQGKNNNINGCCRTCKHLGEKGCSSSNLTCKLIYCKTALGNIKKLRMRDIPILKCLSVFQRMILKASFFKRKEEVLKELEMGLVYSIFIFLKELIACK